MTRIRVLSRDSLLAVRQSELVIDAIRAYDPRVNVELITMKTSGDLTVDRSLEELGGKGLFVRELDDALLDGRGEISVHSCKDMPTELHPELPIVAYSRREDARDALVLPLGKSELDFGKPIGCSSRRRAIQLERLYPGIRVEPIRGNVPTRVRKLDEGGYSALVLAAAGLRRLGLESRISRVFEPSEMIPAACQGIIAVQARRGFAARALGGFNDSQSELQALAERAFVRELGADCFAPIAVYAEFAGTLVRICAMFDGNYDETAADASDAESAAIELAGRFK
jgi:hydroxymethylbilane synthase